MPPVRKAGNAQFRKSVEFTAKDDAAQRAVGVVMVPDKADLQHDFAREDTIRSFASQFETFIEAGEADGGVMHAAWPSEWMTLERNEVLAEAEEIGGKEVVAGAWVQEWQFGNDALWSLVDDGVLEGYSIGAIDVDWNGPFEEDEVDDVAVPDDLGENPLVWELVDGIIREVSAVDIPAVPDAEILEAKSLEKRLAEHVGNRDAFIDEAMERGHSEAEAERLWDVLNDAIEVDGAAAPGKESVFARAGKAFLSALSGDGDAETAATPETDSRKAGETLSQANRESAMAAIDANLDMLEDAGVDHGMTRFTDRDDVDFDLSEHDARAWAGDHDDGDDSPFDVQDSKDAAGGDTPADDGGSQSADTDTMTNGNSDGGDDKSLAETNAEQINELTEQVGDLASDVSELTRALTGEEKTVEIEIDGETHEVPKSQAEAALGVDGGGSDDGVEAEIKELRQRLDNLKRQSGGSDQVRDDGDEPESGLDGVGKMLG